MKISHAARQLAANRKRFGRKPELHEPGCTPDNPCLHCRRREYRRERYERTGKR